MRGDQSDTVAYYERCADSFVSATVHVDMASLYEPFLALVPEGGLILDAGCGSGRDSRAFVERGYRVRAFDASPELAARASKVIGEPVSVLRFENFGERDSFDAIWACASLLHVPEAQLPSCISKLWAGLKPAGAFYLSFKFGDRERVVDGRHFTDATEERIRRWVSPLTDVEGIECWTTKDARPERQETWLNAIVRRRPAAANKIVTGERANPFLPKLSAAMAQATEIDLAVAFVKATGLRLLLDDLHSALGHDEARTRPPARLRVLTSDYLDVTDPDALRLLLLLQEKGAQVRVFEARTGSFHLKAYLFARFDDDGSLHGTAFIGSSNVSRMALTDGLEWNYRIEYPGDPGFIEARARLEELFRDSRTKKLTNAWVKAYELRRNPPPREIAPGSGGREPPPSP